MSARTSRLALPAVPAALAALCLLAAAPGEAPVGTGADGGDRGDGGADAGPRPELRTVSGTVSSVDAAALRVTVEASGGTVVIGLDRNTSVYLESRLGTVRDVAVGASVRAEYGPDGRTAWIEVRPQGAPPAPPARAPADRATP